MHVRPHRLVVAALAALGLAACAPIESDTGSAGQFAVTTDLNAYPSGGVVQVTYDHMSGGAGDHIAIAVAGSPDDTSVRDQATNGTGVGATPATLAFTGLPAGTYEARAYFDWSGTHGTVVQFRSGQFTIACPAGQTYCGSSCVDTTSDPSHCGTCAVACTAGQVCGGGRCGPPGDSRAAPIAISLAQSASNIPVDTTTAVNDTDGPGSCMHGPDVFLSFTTVRSQIVYADTIGATWDTGLFLQRSDGTNITSANLGSAGQAYNDDNGLSGCATGLQSQILARVEPGTYYLVVSGCGYGGGTGTVHFQHLEIGNGPLTYLPPGSSRLVYGATAGTGVLAQSCVPAAGPEDTWWWYTCPSFAGGSWIGNTCGASYDTVLEQRSAARPIVATCNDDNPGTCGGSLGTRSALTATLPAGAGIHAVYIDGYYASSQGGYDLLYTYP